jgi:hypothetical protein
MTIKVHTQQNALRSGLVLAEKLQVSLALARGLWEVIHGHITLDQFVVAAVHDFISHGI